MTSSVVDQDDVILATATVREAITFAARCRLPESITETDKQKRVDLIMESLDLTSIANQRDGYNVADHLRTQILVYI